MIALVLLAVLGMAEIASVRWSVDSRDGFDWRAEEAVR